MQTIAIIIYILAKISFYINSNIYLLVDIYI